MKVGSYKDIVQWFRILFQWLKNPWIRPAAILAALTYLLWRAILWAIAPGFWGGSWLHNENDTALKLANDMFGPVLLVKWHLQAPPGVMGDKWETLRQWGRHESAARLVLIVGILWIVICCMFLIPKMKRAKQGDGANPHSGQDAES